MFSVARAALVFAGVLVCCAVALASDGPPAKPADYTQSISGTLVKFDMVGIPGGEIDMPDPENPGATKRVRIDPFWIGKNEVTWDEYDIFVFKLDQKEGEAKGDADAVTRPSKPYGMADRGYGHRGYPVINVSYLGARMYCKWLSAKTGHTYRLPTEAEWEYACRAGVAPPSQIEKYAWVFQEKTQPVGKKEPNAWGVRDMLGNVAEWCNDMAGKPVVCGGSWTDMPGKVKPTARKYQDDSWRANDPQDPKSAWWLSNGDFVGFRVIRVEKGEGESGQ